MTTKTLTDRCALSEQCLPDAPYRAMLTALHKDMILEIERLQHANAQLVQAITKTVEENRRLADGDNCTLVHLGWARHFAGAICTPPAQPAPVQPVAWVDWLPEGTTHIAKCTVTTSSDGRLSLRTHAFKYEADVLKVYTTDNDNEYPGWIDAKDAFYHLNFAIVPLYITPPEQPAVPDAMTSADIQEHIEYVAGWNDCRQAMMEMMK